MMLAPPQEQIGPGRVVLIVGPSGGGKDTIIAGVKAACEGDASAVFPRRVVTRQSSAAEDHDSLTVEAFDRALGDGTFALWWEAHGLKYGIPRSIDDDVRAGRTVICNVSRGIILEARARYANLDVVLITAPADVLAARLAGRARNSDGPLSERIKRNDAYADFSADYTINNVGAPGEAMQRLLQLIKKGPAAREA